MNLTLGYLKDEFAVFLFAFAFYIVYNTKDLNVLRPIILVGLFVSFLVDGLFTLYPDLHNTHIELFKNKYKKYVM
jgi:hypothetical protein